MKTSLIKVGKLKEVNYITHKGFQLEIIHTGLEERKLIFGTSLIAVEFKVNQQLLKWESKWGENSKTDLLTKDYIDSFIQKEYVDQQNLSSINFERISKGFSEFNNFNAPEKPVLISIPEMPDKNSEEFSAKFNLLENLFQSKKENKIIYYKNKLEHSYRKWEKEKFRIESINTARMQKYEFAMNSWNKKKKVFDKNFKDFEKKKTIYKSFLTDLELLLKEKNEYAILEYADIILNNLNLPNILSTNYETDYIGETGTLIIDFEFPNITSLSKAININVNKDLTGNLTPQINDHQLYNSLEKLVINSAYKIFYSFFKIDKEDHFKEIVLNGYMLFAEKIEGNYENYYFSTLKVTKEEFLKEFEVCDDSKFINKFPNKIVKSLNLNFEKPVEVFNSIRKETADNVKDIVLCGFADSIFDTMKVHRKSYDGLLVNAISKEFNVNVEEMTFLELKSDSFEIEFSYQSSKFYEKVFVKSFKYEPTVIDIKQILIKVSENNYNKAIVFTTESLNKNATSFLANSAVTVYENSDIFTMFITHNLDAEKSAVVDIVS